jgi:hypothetical protein
MIERAEKSKEWRTVRDYFQVKYHRHKRYRFLTIALGIVTCFLWLEFTGRAQWTVFIYLVAVLYYVSHMCEQTARFRKLYHGVVVGDIRVFSIQPSRLVKEGKIFMCAFNNEDDVEECVVLSDKDRSTHVTLIKNVVLLDGEDVRLVYTLRHMHIYLGKA